MRKEVEAILKEWDGTHVQVLQDAYLTYKESPLFFKALVAVILDNSELQAGATWLIKQHYDRKHSLDPETLYPLLEGANELVGWEAQLHLLQILPKVEITEEVFAPLELFVDRCLESENKFVRAWAFQGMYELACFMPELKPELRRRCEHALEVESASIKARVRKVMQKLAK